MRIAFYYKTRRPDIPAAVLADKMTTARTEAQADRFATLFGAVPLFTHGYDSHFAGITFDAKHPCYNSHLWTKVTQEHPLSVPRSPEKAGQKWKAEAAKLYDLFYKEWPKDAAESRASALYTALGLTVEMLSNQALIYQEWQGWNYFVSTLQLDRYSKDLTEIVGSEIEDMLAAVNSPFQPVSEAEALAGMTVQEQQP